MISLTKILLSVVICCYWNQVLAVDVICGLPREIGPCDAIVPRFYYNYTTEKCESFNYGGCGGNDNNFASEEKCKQTCVKPEGGRKDCEMPKCPPDCKVVTPENESCGKCECPNEVICRFPAMPGPCKAAFPRFFYNSESGKCESFVYGGCQGNDNNFDSEDKCKDTCLQQKSATQECEMPKCPPSCKVVTTENDRCGICECSREECEMPKCPPGCKVVTTGNDRCGKCECSREECEMPKCPPGCKVVTTENDRCGKCECSREVICLPPPETGMCMAYFRNFFFNSTSGKCEEFTYGGCGGNANNFVTEEECNQLCVPQEKNTQVDCKTVCPQDCGAESLGNGCLKCICEGTYFPTNPQPPKIAE